MLGLTQEKFYNHAALFTTSLAKLGELFRVKLFSTFRIKKKKHIKLQLISNSIDRRAMALKRQCLISTMSTTWLIQS